ncbi:MAG: ABC transporter permease [Bacteroidetes bacterium]|nr:ABC transporter permease [Bacteroidota bacterium]
MLIKYLKNALRHLWRTRLFTSLNIFGLAISISACWIIFRIVNFEFGYDRGLPNKGKIYRVVTRFVNDEKESYNSGVSKPVYEGVRAEITGLDHVVPVLGIWSNSVAVNAVKGKSLSFDDPSGIAATDTSYFNMIQYHWIVGNKSTALNAPENIVLTESRAKKYFPGVKLEDILHRTVTYYSFGDTVQRTITGIVADLKSPTEFTTQEFCPLPTKAYKVSQWTNTNGTDKLYLQFKDGTKPNNVLSQIETLVKSKTAEFEQKNASHFKFKRWFELIALKDVHFATYIEDQEVHKMSRKLLYGLIGIGLFLLILACINYINMSVAGIPFRAKEIGVRKTLGSSHLQLITQFLSETIITIFFAAILAHAFSLFGFWILKDIIPEGVSLLEGTMQLVAFMLAISVLCSVLAGIYPSWLITKVKTINVFRNFSSTKNSSQKFSFQKALIIFQFVIALVFITCTLIVGYQLRYTLSSDMGFNKDAVVLVDIPFKILVDKKYTNKQFALLNEIKKIPGIQTISLGMPPMSDNFQSSQYEYAQEGKLPITKSVYRKCVDTAYLNLYGMKLLAGRNLRASDTTNEFVINETAMHAFGFKSPEEALGKIIGQDNSKFPIVGVVKDFHSQNFYKTIEPMDFESEKDNLNTFNIKLKNVPHSQWPSILSSVGEKWAQFYPTETFAYKFYDETIAEMYEQERHLSKLVNLATGIAIFVSCIGLFGLAVLTAFQRTKEIGIRKVLGASVAGIVQLLSKEYLVLVIIAIFIATPISWWAMHKWLEGFAYRIQIEWWMFVLAGIMGILVALLTVGFYALRVAKANPVKSLRTE